MKDLKGIEIMHYVLMWCYNWTEEDFQIAFKDSNLGWDYFWNKLQGKCKNEHDPTEAIVGIILNMDKKHQQMLFDYIFNVKYPNEIQSSRDWQKTIEEHKKKHGIH